MKRHLTLLSVLSIAILGFACAQKTTNGDEEYAESMAREHAGDQPVASPMAEGAVRGEISSSTVVYATVGDTEISGHLARPAEGDVDAAVIVIHEWWGLNDNVRAMADKLAAEGYAALAVDLYEGQVAEDRDGAKALMRNSQENSDRLRENLRQAHAWLVEEIGAGKIGVIGWCFGGGWSLQTALMLGDAIDATVIYYGRLETEPAALKPLTSPVLGIFGAEDQGIPIDSVRAFEAALGELGKLAAIHVYEGADHAFANPSGTSYNAEAAEDAWMRTMSFLAGNLK